MVHDTRTWITWIWTAVGGIWLLTALRLKPVVRKQPAAGRVLEITILLAAAVMLFFEWPRTPLLNSPILPGGAGFEFAGLAVTAAGALAAIVARVYLGTNWSGRPSIKEGHELIRRGPYALVRHPIYSGLFLAAIGTAIAFGQTRSLLALPLVLAGFWVKIRAEERLLSQAMGEQYEAYRQTVRSAIIPFIL